MKRRAELHLIRGGPHPPAPHGPPHDLGDRTVLLELEEGPESSTLQVAGRTFAAERRELMRQDAAGELVVGGFVTSFELGDLDADARSVQVTIFELTGAPDGATPSTELRTGSGSTALIRDDHVRLRWRGLGVSSHADVKGRRFRFAADGPPPRVRVGGALEVSLFWAKEVAKGVELCAAVGFGSDAFLALDHETFDATPAARIACDGGREALVLLSERC